MPELPEVENVVRGLRESLAGAVVAGAEERFAGILRGTRGALRGLGGRRLGAITRAGKFILIELEGGWRLLFHLGMSGKLLVVAAAARREPHTHFVLRLADGREVRFSDPRRFGRVVLGRAGGAGDPARQVARGREPLEIGEDEFTRLFWKRSGAIKGLLLNQTLLRGLGNIYADESLHRAGVDPRARRLSRPRLARLRAAIRDVLAEAIAAGGSSIQDYVKSNGERGWFQVSHRVYGREGRPCPGCGTPIRRIVVAGRGTHFCPRCQGP
ncbi:MAG: bifunctional DNA-formamidopyrimidine glycosylase/DNA-(apurinic or apyrimidinic site) lyase [Terriglobales bacterium]